MKTTNEVLKETGLTYPMLNRLKDLGIVPKPKLKGQGRRKGVVGEFEDDVIDIISGVKLQQKLGLSLVQIAENLRHERASLRTVEPQSKIVIPENPNALRSYIKARPELEKQLEKENPGYRLHAIRLESIESEGKRYLVPTEIVMEPKE